MSPLEGSPRLQKKTAQAVGRCAADVSVFGRAPAAESQNAVSPSHALTPNSCWVVSLSIGLSHSNGRAGDQLGYFSVNSLMSRRMRSFAFSFSFLI